MLGGRTVGGVVAAPVPWPCRWCRLAVGRCVVAGSGSQLAHAVGSSCRYWCMLWVIMSPTAAGCVPVQARGHEVEVVLPKYDCINYGLVQGLRWVAVMLGVCSVCGVGAGGQAQLRLH